MTFRTSSRNRDSRFLYRLRGKGTKKRGKKRGKGGGQEEKKKEEGGLKKLGALK